MGTNVCYRRKDETACRGGQVIEPGEPGYAYIRYGGPLNPLPEDAKGVTTFEVTRRFSGGGEEETFHDPGACPFGRNPAVCPFATHPDTAPPAAMERSEPARPSGRVVVDKRDKAQE